MSRPKPKVLIENTNKQTYKSEQVLASEGIWAVFFDNLPINLKTSNPGHAINLARKLNVQFRTDKFSVVLLKQGEKIYPDAR